MNFLRRLFTKPAQTPLSEIRRSFDESASDEEHFPSQIDPRIAHVRLVVRHLGDMSGQRVLDLGCGKGRFARIVQEECRPLQTVGLDLSEAMLGFVPPPIGRCAATMTDLPFADGSFGGAYATESLEHAVDIGKAVKELCRVVKPGGRILIIDKNAEQWGRLETPAWEKWFHRGELEKLLRRDCREVSSQLISYWEDVPPDGLFLAWLAVK